MPEDEKKRQFKAEEFKEMLSVASDRIPALLNSLADILYGKESAQKYGQAVAGFYRTLKESGMTDEQAFKLTEEYMSSLSLGKVLGTAIGRHARPHREEPGEAEDSEGGNG